jgi:hypothetical protein
MKPNRLEWDVWAAVLAVALGVLDKRMQSEALRALFRKSLLDRKEDEFYKYGNGWADKLYDHEPTARDLIPRLTTVAATEATVESVEISAWLDITSCDIPSDLNSEVAAYLAGHASDYSPFGIQCACHSAQAHCAAAAASFAKGALKARRQLNADQVGRLASAFSTAAGFHAKNQAAAENFPFLAVVRQLHKQTPLVLSRALPSLRAMGVEVSNLPAVYSAERKARSVLQRLYEELLFVAERQGVG